MWRRKWLSGLIIGIGLLGMALVMAGALPVKAATSAGDSPSRAEAVEAAEGEQLALSREQALALALTANDQVELNKLSIAKAGLALEQARNAADFDEDYIVTYDLAKFKYVVPRQAEMQLNLAQAGARLQENRLRLTVEKDYYNLLLAEARLANNRAGLERAGEQLRLAQAAFQAGTVAKIDVLGAQVGVAREETGVSAAEAACRQAEMRLNMALGRPLAAPLQLTSKLEFVVRPIDPEQVLEKAPAADVAIRTAQERVAVQEINLAQAQRFYTPNVYAYRQAEYELEEARVSLRQALVDLELQVRSAYLNLQTAARGYQVLSQSLEAAREVYRVARLKYEAGMGTAIEMRKAGDDLQQLETQQLEALANYNLAWAQFKYNLFGGAGASNAGGMPQ